jgi:hypothetical protein
MLEHGLPDLPVAAGSAGIHCEDLLFEIEKDAESALTPSKRPTPGSYQLNRPGRLPARQAWPPAPQTNPESDGTNPIKHGD